nr:hypothetical protein BaRGS_029284 [Batillaria attramentaria]
MAFKLSVWDIDIVVNGEMVHERRETDGTCRHAKNTATLADGHPGLVLVQISNDTDTCYVKEISQNEKDEAKTCKDGTVSRSDDKPDLEEEDLVDGPELPAERLSPQLRDLCAGKKIISMESLV